MSSPSLRINLFIDWLYGKESNADPAIAATANFVRAHVAQRPAAGTTPRWDDFESMKTMARHYGPNTTPAQIDSAIASWGG
jgi:hypothetical protein